MASRVDALTGWAAEIAVDLGIRKAGDASEVESRRSEIRRRAHEDWAASGAMHLTGRRDGPPVLAPAGFATATAGAVQALAALCRDATCRRELEALDGAALLGERAAALDLSRAGATSAGGSCQLLATRDGAIAVQLAREDDVALLDAWLETPNDLSDSWAFVRRELTKRASAEWIERGRLLGLACADARSAPTSVDDTWLRVHRLGGPSETPVARPPLVVDLSSLWAGPLAAQLLRLAGANVVKLESARRPDGARRGPASFYAALNAGKRSVALDFGAAEGIARLRRLIAAADIVIEASRPRALAQLGIDASACVAAQPGKTWLSITGYGRALPFGEWIAFGDDAAVAAGVSASLRDREGEWLFCGDALADPLTGVHAAVAAFASHEAGGGNLLELSLRGVTASVLRRTASLAPATVRATHGGLFEIACPGAAPLRVSAPRLRAASAGGSAAADLGADTAAVLESLA